MMSFRPLSAAIIVPTLLCCIGEGSACSAAPGLQPNHPGLTLVRSPIFAGDRTQVSVYLHRLAAPARVAFRTDRPDLVRIPHRLIVDSSRVFSRSVTAITSPRTRRGVTDVRIWGEYRQAGRLMRTRPITLRILNSSRLRTWNALLNRRVRPIGAVSVRIPVIVGVPAFGEIQWDPNVTPKATDIRHSNNAVCSDYHGPLAAGASFYVHAAAAGPCTVSAVITNPANPTDSIAAFAFSAKPNVDP